MFTYWNDRGEERGIRFAFIESYTNTHDTNQDDGASFFAIYTHNPNLLVEDEEGNDMPLDAPYIIDAKDFDRFKKEYTAWEAKQ